MNTNWQDRSCKKEFLEIKAHKPNIIKLLPVGAGESWDVLDFARLHAEYEQIKGGEK